MSVAIATSDGVFIYFDAVLSYSESYSNSVTKHPIDGGGVISDHVTMENPSFSISGVISAVDFNDTRPNVQDDSTGKSITFINVNPVSFPVEVRDNDKDVFKSIPFLSGLTKSSPKPSITMADEVKYNFNSIKDILIGLRDNNKNANTNYGLFYVYEFRDGLVSAPPKKNCVLLGLDFSETPESGDTLEVSLKIEQVTFVPLVETTLPADVVETTTKDSAATESSKGKQGAAPTTEKPKEEVKEVRTSVLKQGAKATGAYN